MASFSKPSIHDVRRIEIKRVQTVAENEPVFDIVLTGPDWRGEMESLTITVFLSDGTIDYALALQAAVNALPAHVTIPYAEEEAA